MHSGMIRLKKSRITVSLLPANDLTTSNVIHRGLQKKLSFEIQEVSHLLCSLPDVIVTKFIYIKKNCLSLWGQGTIVFNKYIYVYTLYRYTYTHIYISK